MLRCGSRVVAVAPAARTSKIDRLGSPMAAGATSILVGFGRTDLARRPA